MREIVPKTEVSELIETYKSLGGVLDYIFIEPVESSCPESVHKAAALIAMETIDRGWEQWAADHASNELPIADFFRIHCDSTKLVGRQVPFETFWGTDDAAKKPLGNDAWSTPNVDGYKTAFFHPPHGLDQSYIENCGLFSAINKFVLGDEPHLAEIFSWSTDWSNYFDAGREWWGAFFWTIRPHSSDRLVAIGASATD